MRAALDACARGEVSPNVAAMRLWMASGESDALESAALEAMSGARWPARARLRRLTVLLRRFRANLAPARDALAAVLGAEHTPGDPVQAWRAAFDRAAEAAPNASVALYTLGDARLAARTAAEVVQLLRRLRVAPCGGRLLEIGCGLGRISDALAKRRDLFVVGADVSSVMLGKAAKGRAAYVRTDGRELAAFADAAFDAVLACDSFPYLVAAGLERAHVAEAARVLKPGGAFCVLNYSYSDDLAADRSAFVRLCLANGLAVERAGSCDLRLWDGATFLARKP